MVTITNEHPIKLVLCVQDIVKMFLNFNSWHVMDNIQNGIKE